MVSSFMNILYSIDVFGIQLELRKNDRNTFNTVLGSVFSILIYISLIILSFIFGKEIYERKMPRVSSGFEILQPNATDIEITKSYPFTFALRNSFTTELLTYGEYYNIDFKIWDNTNKTAGFKIIPLIEKDVIVQCSINHFNKDYHEALENFKLIHTFMCFNFNNITLRNDKSAPNSLFITLEVKLCNPNIKKCPADFKAKTLNVFSDSLYLDSYLNPKDKNSIIKHNFSKNPQILNIETQKHTYYRISKDILSIDYGWIIEDITNINYFTTQLFQESLVKLNVNDSTVQIIYLETTTKILNTNVKYMKVQDLLANIGGLLNGLIVIGKIILSNYANFSFYLSTYNIITDFHRQNFISEEEKFYSNLLLKNKLDVIKIDSNLDKNNLKQIENDNSQININYQLKNSSNIVNNIKSNIEKSTILNLNDNAKSNFDLIKNKVNINIITNNNHVLKDNNDNLNELSHSNIQSNLKGLSEEDLLNIIDKKINNNIEVLIKQSEQNKQKEINQKITDYFNIIEHNNDYEQEENYIIYTFNTIFCCKSLNKKQIYLSNYLLSYERFLKHSMKSMAINK